AQIDDAAADGQQTANIGVCDAGNGRGDQAADRHRPVGGAEVQVGDGHDELGALAGGETEIIRTREVHTGQVQVFAGVDLDAPGAVAERGADDVDVRLGRNRQD